MGRITTFGMVPKGHGGPPKMLLLGDTAHLALRSPLALTDLFTMNSKIR